MPLNGSVCTTREPGTVQIRMPEKAVKDIDKWVAEGKSASRSEAVKTIVALYQERPRVNSSDVDSSIFNTISFNVS